MVKDRSQPDDVFLDRVKQACLEESNKTIVNASTTMVDQLANNLSYNYVCLVIDIPDRQYHQSSETQGPQDDLGVFEAEDIQHVLYHINYEIEYIPWGVRVILLHLVKFELTLALASSTRRDRQQGWRRAWISQVRGTREGGQDSAIPHRHRVSFKPHDLRCSILAC